ncbi:MAG TPA: PhoH family protein [Bacteroidales bacterium]|mgnify:CR=1 FL=1|nr:PhoH family protein [Bacteroidales bacterium]
MTEKEIYIEEIDPGILFGVHNANMTLIREAFPMLKIMTRGNVIKILGDKYNIEAFEQKLAAIIDYFHQFHSLSKDEVDEILFATGRTSLKTSESNGVLIYSHSGKAIKARTVNQHKFLKEYDKNDLIFAVGPAGTGKTYTAIALAVKALRDKHVKRLILTRPAVEAGEKLGFLPGDMKEKLDPYLQPLYDALHDMMPMKRLTTYLEDGTVQIAPLAFMRGRTLDNAFVILDEAQNATVNQLKMFLTRMGRDAKFIVTGDLTQIDLPRKSQSGLPFALKLLRNIDGISVVEFDQRDIIRHPLVKQIVDAYDKSDIHEND